MKSILRVSSLIVLTFLLLFSSVAPYVHVSAEELDLLDGLLDEPLKESIIVPPGEAVVVYSKSDAFAGFPDTEGKKCYTPQSNAWVYNLNLTSLGGDLDYAFISTRYGNLLDSNGQRIADESYAGYWTDAHGSLKYQKHLSNPNLFYFDSELLTIENTSSYPMKIEWLYADEHESLIPDYIKDWNGGVDCGLAVENLGIPVYKEYTIKPNEVYEFTKDEIVYGMHDNNYIPQKEGSRIPTNYIGSYFATPIESEGELKFDILTESYTDGWQTNPISDTPVVIPDAQKRFGWTRDGTYFISWTKSLDIANDRAFLPEFINKLRVKNTGSDDITITIPYGKAQAEKIVSDEPFYSEMTIKPKERVAYKVLQGGYLGAPEVTILGGMERENYVTWGLKSYLTTSENILSFKNYKAIGLDKNSEKYYYLTNVSDHNLTIAYPQSYVELRKIPVFEDINIISSSLTSNRSSQYFSASGDSASLHADPVDTATGAFTSTMTPLALKGVLDIAIPLNYYSALTTEIGAFGRGWETDYNARLHGGGDLYKIQWSQNRFNDYIRVEGTNNEYVGVDDATKNDRLVITDSYYPNGILYKKDGSQWSFSWGQLYEVTDRTGSITSILKDNYSRISELKDKATGKSLYFSYPYYSNNVESIQDSLGRKVTFTYTNNLISGVTDPEGNITTYEYNTDGKLVSSTDHEGKLLFFNTYDDKGRVIQQENNGITTFNYTIDEETGYQITEVTDRNGNTKKLVHNTELKLIKAIDENGDVTEKSYDSEGNVTQVKDENGNITSFTYDQRGNILTSTDALGTVTSYTYDDSDNITSIQVGDIITSTFVYENNLLKESQDRWGNKTKYTYNTDNQIETMTAPDNGVTSYQYENGLLKTITDPTGVVTNYEHDIVGRLTATVDGEGNRTELTYDKNNNLLTTKDAYGNISSFTYDSRNRKISETDNKGNTTTYTYDDNNNIKTVTDAKNQTSTNEYNAEDQLIKTTDPKGNVTEFILDNTGQIISVKDPLGNTVSTEYDKAGNITKNKDAYGITTSQTEYDALNRPTKTTDALGNQSMTQYNQWSDVTETINALNQSTKLEYYDIGLVNKVTDANNGVTEQEYDSLNRQSSFTDANGNTTSFTYDQAGRTTSITLQNGSTIQYEYDSQGYLSKTTNARGQDFLYEYDKLGRLTKTTKPEGTVTTTYDLNGNVLTKTDENGTVTYEYDSLNRPTKYTDVYGNIIQYAYDENSNLTKLTYPDGKIVKYTYNANNQLITVTDWNNRKTEYTYDKNGRLTRTDHANGTYELREYDKKGQLVKLGNSQSDATALEETIFTYNGVGGITSETTTKDSLEPIVKNYTYDDLNRVTNATNSTSGVSNYTYDAQGNILESSKDALTMGYGDNNWLTSINDQPISYDQDGNALQTIINDNLVSLTYDSLNRLTQAGTTLYEYDANNNRIKLQDHDKITKFVVNPLSQYSQVLMETDDTGRILKRYIYGIGLIGEETLDNNYITYHYDYRGSTVFLTDEKGNKTTEFEYDTYGELLTPSLGYRFLYNGRDGVQTDANGLYYMRARYYNPEIKRFINQDTLLGSISDSTSLNRFSYVNGNPISLVDPFGLEAQGTWLDGAYNWFTNNRDTLLGMPYAAMSVHTYDLTVNAGTGQWNKIGGNLASIVVEAASTPKKGLSTGAKYLNNISQAPKNFKWGKHLKSMVGDPPKDMYDPHAHHIVFKKGRGKQRALVKEGQDILESYGIDPIYGKENLVWAPNRVKGQHSTETLEQTVSTLRSVKDYGGDYDDITKALKVLGQTSANRR